ncbi:LuxR C-terminal-related transcriptional regulator [Rhodococcus sp. ACT016]|uniref:helix-turn-helix transcriptional regulator n=1 Tax=Rhodococcus sp. ACT016 TaxID=3134808 RepID=UPI003D2DCA0D
MTADKSSERYLVAVRSAIDNEAWDEATSILRLNWTEMVASHLEDFRSVLLAFPMSVVEADPLLRAAREMFIGHGTSGRFTSGLSTDPNDLAEMARRPDVIETLAIGTVQASLLRFAGDMASGADFAERLEQAALVAGSVQPDVVAAALPVLRLQWAITCQLAGRRRGANTVFQRAYSGAEAVGLGFVARNSAGSLALNCALAGQLGDAREWIGKWEATQPSEGRLEKMIRVTGLVAKALISLENLDVDSAAADLDVLIDELRDRDEMWAYILFARCQCFLLSGEPQRGIDLIDRFAPTFNRWRTPDSEAGSLLTSVEVDLLCALGRGNVAQMVLRRHSGEHPLLSVARARLALLTGDPETALAEATRVSTGGSLDLRARVDGLLIAAVACLQVGRPDDAIATWRRATALAESVGTVRPLAMVPPGALNVLTEAGATLPHRWNEYAHATQVLPDTVPVVALSDRELVVLSALAEGLSGAETAAKLFVSQNTVKTQVQSLFRKLAVHNKTDAVRAAMALRLL